MKGTHRRITPAATHGRIAALRPSSRFYESCQLIKDEHKIVRNLTYYIIPNIIHAMKRHIYY